MRLLIDSWSNCKVVREADKAQDALAALDAVKPDLILFFCHPFPRKAEAIDCLEDIAELVKASSSAPVVLLTNSRDAKLPARAVKTGARGVLCTRDVPTDLHNAINRTFSGGLWITTTHPGRAYNHRPAAAQDDVLTSREREVAALVVGGCTDRQVSAQLGITWVTVRHHLNSIFNKLRIANRFELIAWAYRNKTPISNA
jgi:DNA-binding NarL/FixJ family response regulator